jgi:hypothetical protein
MPLYGRQDRQRGTKIGADRGDVEQHNREHLLDRVTGGRDPAGECTAHYVVEIAAGVTPQMIEQIEPGLRLVDEHGAITEPAPKTPEQALAGQQAQKQGERPPHGIDVLRTLCHRVDDQLQAVLRGAGDGGRS